MAALNAPSQVLERNLDELTGNTILVVDFQQDGFLAMLKAARPDATIYAYTANFANAEFAKSIPGIELVLSAELPNCQADCVIYYFPKAKQEAQMRFDNIRAITKEDAELWVVGDNKGGVKSTLKMLKSDCQAVRKFDSARHCGLYLATGLKACDFTLQSYCKTSTIDALGTELHLTALPGVFSYGELDIGTRDLLAQLKFYGEKRILDFGCGAGVIAAYLLKQNSDLKITCLDVSALAIYATEQTLKANGVSAELLLSDGLSEVSGNYHAIVSNPPFHTGIKTDYSIAERFLADAKHFLKQKGSLTLVANTFLQYPPILDVAFGSYQTLSQTPKFTVYQALK